MTTTRPIVSSTALLALLLAGSSPAQPAADGRPPKPLVDLALDADGDEVLSAAEIASAPAALRKLDRNRDGKLTPGEYRPPRPDDGVATPGDKGAARKPQ